MGQIKKILYIGYYDLRLTLRDKPFFFWTVFFPILFIIIFGSIYSRGTAQLKASLLILNQDKGEWGDHFISKLSSPDILIEIIEHIPETYARVLIIPEDFSLNLSNKEPQSITLQKHHRANVRAAMQIETKIIQAIAKTITELVLYSNKDINSFFEDPAEFRDIIKVTSKFPQGTITTIPGGYDHTIPGIIIMFMMMITIHGGVSIMEDRKTGILTRILYSNVSLPVLWTGKFFGRWLLAIFQAVILIITGLIFFNFNMGNTILFIINIILFSLTVSSLTIFIGSILDKEDLIIGTSILLANIFAALGGCWWPIEIVPETIRRIAMATPGYWAMDTFTQIIFFNKGFHDIIINYIVLICFTLLFIYFAIKFFKTRP